MDGAKTFYALATGYVGPSGTVSHRNKYCGLTVVAATAAAALLIRDGVGGTVVAAIPATSGIGYRDTPMIPIDCPNGVYLDLNGGTGTLAVHIYD